MEINKSLCPICGEPNNCRYEKGLAHEGCWCETIEVPKELRNQIPEPLRGKACICRKCVEEYKNNKS